MSLNAFETLLREHLPDCDIRLQAEGNHYHVLAVGACFAGLSQVKRQQLVYAGLKAPLADGTIHALVIKAHTPEEWATLAP